LLVYVHERGTSWKLSASMRDCEHSLKKGGVVLEAERSGVQARSFKN
jgi:hypothetical protein